MKEFTPQYLVIDNNALDYPISRNIIQNLPEIRPIILAENETFNENLYLKELEGHSLDPITAGKEILWLTKAKTAQLKACPGMGEYVCCNYYVINFSQNCHLECSYCFLQDYLTKHSMIVHPNVDEILASVEILANSHPDRVIRIGTGELADSLAIDDLTGLTNYIIPFFEKIPNVVLELKTKTANINNLLQRNGSKNVLVSWSINPEQLSEREERFTDSIADRLKAARKCLDAGYQIAFHFDPLIVFPGWENAYEGLLALIETHINFNEISWVSLGSLRFNAYEIDKIKYRHKESQIVNGEFFKSPDGKWRYFRPIREEIIKTVRNMIQSMNPELLIYLCMERDFVWNDVFESDKSAFAHLDRQFKDRLISGMKILPALNH